MADPPAFDLMTLHQMRSQALFRVRPHLAECVTGVTIVEVTHPPAQAGIHVSDDIIHRYRREFTTGQLLETCFDFCKGVFRRADMCKAFPRAPTLAHPDFKTQEVEAFLSGINTVGLGLVKREIKSMQHASYQRQRRFYAASA